jgi:calcineurin-like phosphoesterase family protein
VSDPHYGHVNLCSATSVWKDFSRCRKFESLDEMNDWIVNRINSVVGQDDELYCLGDWSFGGIENIWNFRKRIICSTIYEVLGNHDDHIRNNKQLPNCKFNDWYPGEDSFNGDYNLNAQEIFMSVDSLLELTIGKQLIITCHHPIDHWRDAEKGSIMLHGHLHGKLNNCETNLKYRRKDVGIDCGGPFSLDEILEEMNKCQTYKRSNDELIDFNT